MWCEAGGCSCVTAAVVNVRGVDCMLQTALAALVHADCDVQADGRQQHRRLGTP